MNDPLAPFRPANSVPKAKPIPEKTEEKQGAKEPYEAFRLSKQERRFLELRPPFPQPAEAIHNGLITKIVGEWRMGLGVTVTCGTAMVIDIAGENLTELFQAVKECRVEWLQEFDPESHLPPTDTKAPFIKRITITTTRPEALPPIEQRH